MVIISSGFSTQKQSFHRDQRTCNFLLFHSTTDHVNRLLEPYAENNLEDALHFILHLASTFRSLKQLSISVDMASNDEYNRWDFLDEGGVFLRRLVDELLKVGLYFCAMRKPVQRERSLQVLYRPGFSGQEPWLRDDDLEGGLRRSWETRNNL